MYGKGVDKFNVTKSLVCSVCERVRRVNAMTTPFTFHVSSRLVEVIGSHEVQTRTGERGRGGGGGGEGEREWFCISLRQMDHWVYHSSFCVHRITNEDVFSRERERERDSTAILNDIHSPLHVAWSKT